MSDPAPSPAPASSIPPLPATEARFHPFSINEVRCVVLSDGSIPVPAPAGSKGPSDLILRPLACLLVRLPGTDGLALIDAGFGRNPKRAGQPLPTAGRLSASLAAAGIPPEQIGTVLISHIHPDHVDGLYGDDGVPTFPNATYRVGAEELAFWSQHELDLGWSPAPDPLKAEMLAAARRLLGFAGGSLGTFRAGEPAMPGVGTMLLPGHTPGQVGFTLASGSERLLYTADAVTTPEISIGMPERHHPLDLDPVQAVETRKAILRLLAQPGWRSFSPHFPWPNLVTVQNSNGQYAWTVAA